jgi:hypothetical protein
MSALDLLRSISGSDDSIDRSHHSNRFPLDYDTLEPRQLLSAGQAPNPAENVAPEVVGTTAGSAETAGIAGQPGGASSVVTHAVGDVDSLQSEIPVNDLVANLSQVTTAIYSTNTGISAASGLTSLPITPLLTATVTSNETPLNNGTPDLGTVWITPPPVTPGLFHTAITDSPVFSATWMQTVNPQGGTPTSTHLGQSATGGMNGAAVNEAVAVGPIGSSMTEEIQAVQPAPVEAHQPAPPVQVQQDESAPQQNAQTPPGGQQRGAGGESSQGAPATIPQAPAGQGAQGGSQGQPGNRPDSGGEGPTGGAQGGSGSGAGAFLLRHGHDGADPHLEEAIDLIDAAIPALVMNSPQNAGNTEDGGALPTVFGAAAVAAGGLHLALRGPEHLGRGLVTGPPDGARPDSRRNASPSRD